MWNETFKIGDKMYAYLIIMFKFKTNKLRPIGHVSYAFIQINKWGHLTFINNKTFKNASLF